MRGQVQQAFTFIMFALIAAFVLFLGYKGIMGLLDQGCDAQRATFEKKIVGFFDKYDDYGSVHNEQVKLPCSYRAVCFMDSELSSIGQFSVQAPGNQLVTEEQKDFMKSAIGDRNIFLVGEFVEPIAWSEKLDIESGTVLCVQQTGTVNLVFEGQGQKTQVRRG